MPLAYLVTARYSLLIGGPTGLCETESRQELGDPARTGRRKWKVDVSRGPKKKIFFFFIFFFFFYLLF